MKIDEILLELGDQPAEYTIRHDPEYIEAIAEELDLALYISRGLGPSLEEDTVFIEFQRHGRYDITKTGDSVKVFSTVKHMVKNLLPKFLKSTDNYVEFASEKSEPSRVKLYNRIVPTVSQILGPNWENYNRHSTGTLQIYSWKRKNINEKAVESTWITDLTYNRPNKILTMRLSNGRTYSIPNITRSMFEQWTNSESKGNFFHNYIKNSYRVSRIK